MDASDVIWQSDAVRAAINSGDRGAIVRGVRRAQHLTLAQLAARSGYSISTLSRMERGLQPLTDIRVLRSLADALGIPPHVFGLADTPRRGPSPSLRSGRFWRRRRRLTRCVVARCLQG